MSRSVQGGSTVSYTYDGLDRLISATGMGFDWDLNGNLLYMNDGSYGWNYTYDSLNRLTKVHKDSTISAIYTYDAEGRRVRSWDTVDGTTDYVYRGLYVIDEVRGGAHERHVYAGSMHLASSSSGTIEYFHVDHLGSTRLKTNSTGGAIYESNYEPYGPGIGESGSEEFRYTGKQEDATGLYYYGARYYDPATGRFTTRDAFPGFRSDPQSLNRYSYCTNNPLKYIDPTGNYGFSPIDPTGIIATASFIGAIFIETTLQVFGWFMTGIINPSPELDTPSIEEITGGYYESASVTDLQNYLEESGIILSGDEDQYDDFVENLGPIEDTSSHRKHATSKNMPFEEYRGSAVKDELSFRLDNLDDPTINLYYDRRTGNWNIEQYGDVIGFNYYKVTTWLQTGYNFNRDRWIPFPVLPLPP